MLEECNWNDKKQIKIDNSYLIFIIPDTSHNHYAFIFSRGYAKRRNGYCCGSEYANLSLTLT